MMVVLNMIVLAAIFLVAVGIVWVVWLALTPLLAKRYRRPLAIGLPVAALMVVVALLGLWQYFGRPSAVFQNEFGLAVPGDTTALAASSFALGDSGYCFLHFKTTQSTFDQLAKGYYTSNSYFSTNVSKPRWYTPSAAANAQRLVNEQKRTSFANEHRELCFDPSTGDAWYFFIGID